MDEGQGLNAAQRLAVESPGPMMVLAGPGTGKTRVIGHRIERLVREGAEPESILALTFTVKAADELRGRLAALIGPGRAERVRAHTFHGYGRQLTQRYADQLGLPARQVLVDKAQRQRMVLEAAESLALPRNAPPSGRRAWAWTAMEHIDAFRHAGVFADRAVTVAQDELRRAEAMAGEEGDAARARAMEVVDFARVYEAVERMAMARGHLEFEHFILLPIRLMRDRAGPAAMVRDEIRHVVVDEFQDVNTGQIELLALLVPPSERRPPDVCVVGDDDQAIYMFRGADDRAMARFARLWSGATCVSLTENYRSGARILEVSASVMSRAAERFAPDKVVTPALSVAGVSVERVSTPDEVSGGEPIAALIRADMSTRPGARYRDYAVLGRINKDLESIAAALEIEEIPFEASRARSWGDEPGVRDLRHWVWAAADPGATTPLLWLLTRPPARASAERVATWAGEHRAMASRRGEDAVPGFAAWLAEQHADEPEVARFLGLRERVLSAIAGQTAEQVVETIIRIADLAHADLCTARERERRVEGLVGMMRFAAARAALLPPPGGALALHEYLDDLESLDKEWRDEERVDGGVEPAEETDRVRLMTAHSAKGLEFDTVFVARVCPPNGFPKTRGENRVVLPDAFLDRAGDTRTTKERALDEERRLFYVACTRAKRRLVLLAKQTKGKSSSTHYLQELDAHLSEPIPTRTTADVIESAAAAGIRLSAMGFGTHAGAGRAGRIEHAAREGRLAAATALDALEASPDSPGEIERAAAALRAAAGRVAAAACARLGRDASRLGPEAASLAAELARPEEVLTLRPMTPPLHLSYSAVRDYLLCGRCYYLKRVLGCPEEPSERQDVGNSVHAALRRYFQAWREAEAEGRAPPTVEQLVRMGREEYEGALGPARALEPGTWRTIEAMLRQGAAMHGAADQILELEWSVTFPYEHAGVSHRFTAKFDRADLAGDGGHRIIDYKTGAETKKLLEPKADDLQLGVYALAMRHQQGVPMEDRSTPALGVAEYWHLPTGRRGVLDMASVAYDRVREEIGRAIDGMLAGRFERGDKCEGGLCEWLG
ncbi:MAG: ATP-dependent helicase [Phycisphaerales bacterium]